MRFKGRKEGALGIIRGGGDAPRCQHSDKRQRRGCEETAEAVGIPIYSAGI